VSAAAACVAATVASVAVAVLEADSFVDGSSFHAAPEPGGRGTMVGTVIHCLTVILHISMWRLLLDYLLQDMPLLQTA
jgi:hypothetical protein